MSVELSETENGVVGAGAGAVEVTLSQPLNYLKNARQQGLPFTMNPRILYRGYSANLVNNCSAAMLQFAIAGTLQRLVTRGEAREPSPGELVAAAVGAGVASAAFVGPLELVMIRQQVAGGSVVRAVRDVVSPGGSYGARGVVCTAAREGIYSGGVLGIAPVVRQFLTTHFPEEFANEEKARLCGSVVSGVLCTYLSHPFDTVKTCMQGDVERKTYDGLLQSTRKVLELGGLRRLYFGAVYRCARLIIDTFIMDKSRVILSPLLFPDRYS